MQSEHAHINFHPSVANEARIHSEDKVQRLAEAALKNIKGSQEHIDSHFNKGPWEIPYSFAPKKHVNLPFSLGW